LVTTKEILRPTILLSNFGEGSRPARIAQVYIYIFQGFLPLTNTHTIQTHLQNIEPLVQKLFAGFYRNPINDHFSPLTSNFFKFQKNITKIYQKQQ